ncbi:MAG: amidohydrolase family protein [Azoarcus sp.]|jgi:allantoinase|nr:amidohydrolase family protein [Azoarcus sp.]
MNTALELTLKGNIVLPDRVLENGIVGIAGGKIEGIYPADSGIGAPERLDLSGKLIFPGLVDPHVHSLSNPGEGIAPATASAAVGGVTTVIEMPYDKAGAINTPERLSAKRELVAREAHVDVALLATLAKRASKEEVKPLLRLSPCGIKLSVFETDPVRFPRIDDDVLWELLPELARFGVVTGFHAENDVIIEHLIRRSKDEGKTHARQHCKSRPPITESLAVGKLLELAWAIRFPLHIHHVSHPRCFDLIRWYREQGLTGISVETCPHYLALCEDDMERIGSFGKINPPLRDKAAVESLWESVKAGEVDMIGSDHSPWSLEQKNHGSVENIFASASGAAGLEAIFPVMYTEAVVKRGLTPGRLAALLAENPARRFGFGDRKGRIEAGLDADFAVVDPAVEWAFDASNSLSTAKWSPYAGKKVKGRIVRTILRGRTIYADGTLRAKPGDGRFVPVRYAGVQE